ncbi:LysR family transcriptional regulator [Chelatococcus reniformis]|uniref:LysR family transcriptional regulator n=1 Tax=Chelatococcus reniformis TaxID=1494448 RepID=A0A916UWA4_9HYPH|nr:LysR family transcriptional regulator [Chelatococcus reniformis]GGC91556.1 LysR family transcriptional regulator [Chelatococcus reniformis]
MLTLDIEAVRVFVMVAELRSFTRAADALGTTQGAISVKLKRLEDRIGSRLLERTPRSVRLSAQGAAFLEGARELISAHERAVAGLNSPPRRFGLGIAAHVAGPEVPTLLGRLHAHDPHLTIEVQLDSSRRLLDLFDQGRLDAAIVQREDDRRDGEMLARERAGWFATQGFEHRQGEPLRLAALSPTCGVRDTATRLLDAAGIKWTEVFLGGGSSAVHAAVAAGVAVAPLSYRIAPAGTVDIGGRFGLPQLPSSDVVLHSSLTDQRSRAALRVLAAAFREHREPTAAG